MTTAVRALIGSAWREQYNQSWRFSKVGTWPFLLEVGIAALLLWRLVPTREPVPLTLPIVVTALLSTLGASVIGLLGGREALFGRAALRTLHVSPAMGGSILVGIALSGVPGHLFSSLVTAVVIGHLLSSGVSWWHIPLLWSVSFIGSLLGYLAALISLVAWVRVTPRSLAVLWGIAVVIGLNLIIALLFLLSVGLPVALIAAALSRALPWLLGGAGLLVGLPVLILGIRAVLRPAESLEWYRDAYLNLQEMAENRRRTRPSRWPRVLPGAAGALQARQWREIWLNGFTWVRCAVLLLPFGLLIWPTAGVIALADRFPTLFVLGFGLLAALGAFGEVAAAIGCSDGPNIGLSMVAGVRARQVVVAKWVAALPLAVPAVVGTWATGSLLGRTDPALSLAAGCIALGFGAIAVTGGLFDLDPHAEVTEREVPAFVREALEQMPRKPGSLTGYVSGSLFAGATVWFSARFPGLALPLAAWCALLAHAVLLAGYRRLRHLGM